jgi:hypothetical protein
LLVIACLLFIGPGLVHAGRQLVYGPIDEAYHFGYAAKIARTGTPPVAGRSRIVIGLHRRAYGDDVAVPAPNPGSYSLSPDPGVRSLPQVEAVQPPVYYYVVAPLLWFVDDSHEVWSVRVATLLLAALGIPLLYLAVRVSAPDRPLSAGLASMILGTATGFEWFFSQVQNDALLMPLCAGTTLYFIRDLRQRRCGYGLAVTGGLAAATQVVSAPAVAAGLLVTWWHSRQAHRLGPELKRLLVRSAVLIAPLALWFTWNVYNRGTPLPGGAGSQTTHYRLAFHQLSYLYTALNDFFTTVWIGTAPHNGHYDTRPPDLILLGCALSLVVALANGAIDRIRRTVALWGAITIAWFFSTYEVLLVHASGTGGRWLSFESRYFVAAVTAGSGLAALVITSAFDRSPRLTRAVVLSVSAFLATFALQTSTLHWLAWL